MVRVVYHSIVLQATDIFIEDDNCLVDFNPSNSEFNALQNQMGLKEVGVLTGDYKLNQPKNSRVQKQGLMEVPLLDDDIDKQAFLMEILKNFNDDTFELIADSQSYVLPEILGFGDGYGAIIKLSVFSNGSFQGDYQLEQNKDFYIKNEQLFLKPNEVLDRNNFSEGNYSLQFDFLKRYDQQDLYVAEVFHQEKK